MHAGGAGPSESSKIPHPLCPNPPPNLLFTNNAREPRGARVSAGAEVPRVPRRLGVGNVSLALEVYAPPHTRRPSSVVWSLDLGL